MDIFSGECDIKKQRVLEKSICESFPFISKKLVGYSVLSREIFSFTIGKGEQTLLCGAFHGMERITSMLLMKFLYDMAKRYIYDERICSQLSARGVTVIPMLNPDGVEISANGAKTAKHFEPFVKRIAPDTTQWQANAHGVDLNHNFNAGWHEVRKKEILNGYILPDRTRYGGKKPHSEPETIALVNHCKTKKYRRAAAFHSQGREIYYDFGKNTPKESLCFAKRMAELSGYTVSTPESLATGGGFKDWFIDYFKKPAFTIEVGIGKNPLSPSVFNDEYKRIEKMLWYLIS